VFNKRVKAKPLAGEACYTLGDPAVDGAYDVFATNDGNVRPLVSDATLAILHEWIGTGVKASLMLDEDGLIVAFNTLQTYLSVKEYNSHTLEQKVSEKFPYVQWCIAETLRVAGALEPTR
jgi:hypothetical protein